MALLISILVSSGIQFDDLTKAQETRNYSSDSFVAALSRVIFSSVTLHIINFFPDQISFLCKQDSKMLHEQQPDSNRPTIIETFRDNSLFNP